MIYCVRDLSGNLPDELQRYALAQRQLNPGRILELLPPYNAECPAGSGANATCSDRGNYFPTVLRPADCPQCGGTCCPPWQQPPPQSEQQHLPRMVHRSWNLGSADAASSPSTFGVLGRPPAGTAQQNGWVVDGRFTTTGKPLLANDLHLAFTAPSSSLLMHLACPTCVLIPMFASFVICCCRRGVAAVLAHGVLRVVVYRYNAIGTAFAGLPFIFVGHNQKVGWGMTQAGSDVQDLYILTPSGDGYTLDGSTKAFETRALDMASCMYCVMCGSPQHTSEPVNAEV